MLRRYLRYATVSVLVAAGIVATYFLAALFGALIPREPDQQFLATNDNDGTGNVEIYLLSTLLHVDIAIPLTDEVKTRFGFLKRDDFPLEHPDLRYLVIGWGSRAFYPSSRTWSDIAVVPTITAITADDAVMHVGPARDVSSAENATKLTLSANGFTAMVSSLLTDFERDGLSIKPAMDVENYGQGDLFYKAHGHFNIFQPCNIWTANKLRTAGITTGYWTPTTYSLMMSLK